IKHGSKNVSLPSSLKKVEKVKELSKDEVEKLLKDKGSSNSQKKSKTFQTSKTKTKSGKTKK
ncbi:MAG: hypothetical protein K9K80_00420, partial [Spirochaetia bacterium]|nr:hypothetical protein [Spirochaetia bacterium]